MAGRLLLCSTPIGNLGDVSSRLAAALAEADVVFAEDTRRAGKLLRALGLERPLRSFFVGNEERRAAELTERLIAGETVALVTDAGTPSISDPGVSAVAAAVAADATVSIVPGPSAVTAALAVSGFGADRFAFEGFLPRRGRARRERIEAVAAAGRTVVVFSAATRVGHDLEELAAAAGENRRVVVARELTKLHEEIWRGSLGEAARAWNDPAVARGEFTLVVEAGDEPAPDLASALAEVLKDVAGGRPLSDAVRQVSDWSGVSRRALYEAALAEQARSTI